MLTTYTLLFYADCTVNDICGNEENHVWSSLKTNDRLIFFWSDKKFECTIGGINLHLSPGETGSVTIELLSLIPFDVEPNVGDEFVLGVLLDSVDEIAFGKVTKLVQRKKCEIEDL